MFHGFGSDVSSDGMPGGGKAGGGNHGLFFGSPGGGTEPFCPVHASAVAISCGLIKLTVAHHGAVPASPFAIQSEKSVAMSESLAYQMPLNSPPLVPSLGAPSGDGLA